MESKPRVKAEQAELTADYAIKTIREQRRDKLFVNRMDMLDLLLKAYDEAVEFATAADLAKEVSEDALELASRVRLDLEAENATLQKELLEIRHIVAPPARTIMATITGAEEAIAEGEYGVQE